MKIFFIAPFTPEFKDIYETVKRACEGQDLKLMRADLIMESDTITAALHKEITEADLIIADITLKNPNVMYELGLAYAFKKPSIILFEQGETVPFDIALNKAIVYDRSRLVLTLELPLQNLLLHKSTEDLLNELEKTENEKSKLKTVFVSYSHVDLNYLNRLEVHLRPFEKAGQIEVWSDTRIKAGEKWKERIESSLNKAAIAILLISADFLASDFIVDNELPPLLKLAEERGTVIVPVILKPCRFTRDPNLSKFQSINDPKNPLSKMDENEREEVFVKIADFVDSLL